MARQQTLWGVTSYDLGGNTGYVVHALFTTKKEADRYASVNRNEYEIEEFTLYDTAPDPYVYWHRGAHVYPDGEVQDWCQEHAAQPPGVMAPADDHLEPWDGHTQGHCGLHISIFGSDRQAVEAAFARQVAEAKTRSNGMCSCGRTELWQRDFWDDPVRDRERAECAKTHDGGWCPTCYTFTVRFSTAEAAE